MTERRRSAWSALADEWDPDHPSLALMREALAPRPVDAPGPLAKPEVAPDSTGPLHHTAEDTQRRRTRISQLIARIRAGDLSARQALEELLK
jgi:hypothetical protein